jgi:hypothetical protein
MEEQHAVVMKKSSECPVSNGSGTLPSEQDAACPFSMMLAKEFSEQCGGGGLMVEVDAETLASLVLMYIHLRGETFSGDAVYLAFRAARSRAEKMGIEPEVVEDVALFVEKYGGALAKANPISGMF